MAQQVQGVIGATDIQSDQRLQAAIVANSGLAPQAGAAAAAAGHGGADHQADGVEYRLGVEAVERSFGAESPIARKMRRMRAVSASIRASSVPADRETFRQDVRRHLMRTFGHDEAFRRAILDGTLVIQTTDEAPELNFQPIIQYTVYREGLEKGMGEFSPPGFNDELYHQLGQTRHQTKGNLGMRQYYAWWPQ